MIRKRLMNPRRQVPVTTTPDLDTRQDEDEGGINPLAALVAMEAVESFVDSSPSTPDMSSPDSSSFSDSSFSGGDTGGGGGGGDF